MQHLQYPLAARPRLAAAHWTLAALLALGAAYVLMSGVGRISAAAASSGRLAAWLALATAAGYLAALAAAHFQLGRRLRCGAAPHTRQVATLLAGSVLLSVVVAIVWQRGPASRVMALGMEAAWSVIAAGSVLSALLLLATLALARRRPTDLPAQSGNRALLWQAAAACLALAAATAISWLLIEWCG